MAPSVARHRSSTGVQHGPLCIVQHLTPLSSSLAAPTAAYRNIRGHSQPPRSPRRPCSPSPCIPLPINRTPGRRPSCRIAKQPHPQVSTPPGRHRLSRPFGGASHSQQVLCPHPLSFTRAAAFFSRMIAFTAPSSRPAWPHRQQYGLLCTSRNAAESAAYLHGRQAHHHCMALHWASHRMSQRLLSTGHVSQWPHCVSFEASSWLDCILRFIRARFSNSTATSAAAAVAAPPRSTTRGHHWHCHSSGCPRSLASSSTSGMDRTIRHRSHRICALRGSHAYRYSLPWLHAHAPVGSAVIHTLPLRLCQWHHVRSFLAHHHHAVIAASPPQCFVALA